MRGAYTVSLDHNRLFDHIVHDSLQRLLELNPLMGTQLGLHEYDAIVPRIDKKWVESLEKLMKETLDRLGEVDAEKLRGPRRIDYEVLVRGLRLELRELREWPLHKMMPYAAMMLGELFTPLLTRSYLPRNHVVYAIEARLSQLENVLLAPMELVEEPYQLWIDMALQVAQGAKPLLELVKAYGASAGRDWSREIEEAAAMLDKVIDETKRLRGEARPGFKPIGRELFVERLRARFIEESPEELRSHGYREAEKYRSMMLETARAMGASSIEEALERIKEKKPRDPDEAMRWHRETVEKVRRFVADKNIVELPVGEDVEVVETPPHLRPIIPFAAYVPPEIFHYSMIGQYYVTKPQNEEMLSHFNAYDVLNTTIHETYPGHHVQLCYARSAPTLLRKAYFNPPDFVEGWAHYTEWLMLEEGIDPSPEYRLKVLHDALWRAVRVYVDVELSTGMIGFQEAVEKLVKDAYLPQQGAVGEALRYTFTPAYQLSYNYGKTRIMELRERAKKLLGPRYSHALFHKMLLEEGNLPINVLSRIVIEKLSRYVSMQ